MVEKRERNIEVALFVLDGNTLSKAAERFGITVQCVENLLTHYFRNIMPEEERLRYLSAKVAAKEYRERLLQKVIREKINKELEVSVREMRKRKYQ